MPRSCWECWSFIAFRKRIGSYAAHVGETCSPAPDLILRESCSLIHRVVVLSARFEYNNFLPGSRTGVDFMRVLRAAMAISPLMPYIDQQRSPLESLPHVQPLIVRTTKWGLHGIPGKLNCFISGTKTVIL